MLKDIYNQEVTILNKLKRTDSGTNKDVWYKTHLTGVGWYTNTDRTVNTSGVVVGTYKTVLIPFTGKYLKYKDWKISDKGNYYTMSNGDYIVLGNVDEDVTDTNVIQVMQSYGEDCCVVKGITVAHERFGAHIELKIEGV